MNPHFTLLGVDTPLFAFSMVPFVLVIAAGLLYGRACSVLEGRGRRIGWGQRACYYAGLALILIATETFIDPVGEHSLLSAHMLQHLLIADLPAPLLLIGIRAPLLYFFWPAPVLKSVARMRPLRAFWAWLRRPPVALGVWLLTLYVWHVPMFYEAALNHRIVHDLEHLTFTLTGVLAYWPLLDPTHHRVEGRVWKAGYVFIARIIGGVMGILITVWPSQIYHFYGSRAHAYGMSILTDQRIAGGMMMMVDSAVVLIGVTYFLVTTERGREHDDDMPESARAAYLERDAAR